MKSLLVRLEMPYLIDNHISFHLFLWWKQVVPLGETSCFQHGNNLKQAWEHV